MVIVVVVALVAGLFGAHILALPGSSGPTAPPGHEPPPVPNENIFQVSFTEVGLPQGTPWSVNLGTADTSSTNTSITFGMANGSSTYTVAPVAGFTAQPPRGTVNVSGRPISELITFNHTAEPGPYAVVFNETGLPPGTNWSVGLNGTTGTSITVSISYVEANGTYNFTIGPVGGYTSAPSAGDVKVNGRAPAPVRVVFSRSGSTQGTYPVTFAEQGLPPGTDWSVTLAGTPHGSATSVIPIYMPNGSFVYSVGPVAGYATSTGNGTVLVAGHAVYLLLNFTTTAVAGPSYPMNFTETGLPADAFWSVGLVLETGASGSPVIGGGDTGAYLQLNVPNGTYVWTAVPYRNYTPTPDFGVVHIVGSPVTTALAFAVVKSRPAQNYSVIFTETGLPIGTTWTTTVYGAPYSASAGQPIDFTEPNGTYYYSISANATQEVPAPAQGIINVTGANASEAIVFQYGYTVSFTASASGGFSGTWFVTINGSENGGYGGGPPINFTLTNGTYAFSVSATGDTPIPSSGTLTVAGHPVSRSVTMTALPTNTVTFNVAGLPAALPYWQATLYTNGGGGNAIFATSGSTTLTFTVPDGAYSWDVVPVAPGYVSTTLAGGALVQGTDLTESIRFTYAPADRLVLFMEESYYYDLNGGSGGVPNGSSWSVSIGNSTETSSGMFLLFAEPNGTYDYTIQPPRGYFSLPTGGTLTVESGPAALQITSPAAEVDLFFSPGPLTPMFSGGGGGVGPAGAPGPVEAPAAPVAGRPSAR
ncbi:MAG: hypothetical protein ACYDFT_01695 [Thermoplasmata archaeon]